MAEQLVQHYADRWVIARLAGMVGPGLHKNPVYDILHGQPLRIHPESQYQFVSTEEAARMVWSVIERGIENEIFNVCGEGLISPAEIARLAGREMNLSLLNPTAQPRIVNVNNEKIKRIGSLPPTHEAVAQYVKGWQ
jgi:nucleoside-diphosphate-sugar epimerase